METYVWYFMRTDELMDVIKQIESDFPCFVSVTTIEMNWISVQIIARVEDMATIEDRLAPYI